jgi:hypothetical protein
MLTWALPAVFHREPAGLSSAEDIAPFSQSILINGVVGGLHWAAPFLAGLILALWTVAQFSKWTDRRRADGSTPDGTAAAAAVPACPACGQPMVRRVAGKGPSAGRPFWGCGRFPACRGTRPI